MRILSLLTKNEKSERLKEDAQIDAKLLEVRFFPGSQANYEALVGYPVKIIDTKDRDMGVRFGYIQEVGDKSTEYICFNNFNFRKNLVEQGIEALINCNYSLGGNNFVEYRDWYGLPVAKK